jgi:8-oxo-dGTP diphosphatase
MYKDLSQSIVIVAACVLLKESGVMLIAKRPKGRELAGLWELPGGKLELGEAPETALVRELREELGIEIAEKDLRPLSFASHAYPAFRLLMPIYLCRHWQGRAAGLEGQDLAWVQPEDLKDYAMPPADEPLKQSLPALLGALAGKA